MPSTNNDAMKKKCDEAANIVVNKYGDAMKNLAGEEWWGEEAKKV